ncbi:hypothetical protein Py04_1144 [Pyrococcus sp. ST04]|nr:hypothetical protein Py04_1144 [Pyrococcus sp. ST04]
MKNFQETLNQVDLNKIMSLWKPLPPEKPSKVYAVDGSRATSRLSGTIIYFLSSYAVGSGKSYRLNYANAMQYNYDISDQLIRMQMETLENMLGYLAGEKLNGKEKLILMDGTLTGSIIRPPVYPKDIQSIETVRYILGEDNFEELILEFLTKLKSHYSRVSDALKGKKEHSAPILADEFAEEFRSKYLDNMLLGYLNEKIEVKLPRSLVKREGIPLSVLREAAEEGKSALEVLKDFEEDRLKVKVSRDDIEDAIHVILAYVEYLYSLDKLLTHKNVVYIAKSFYTKKLASELGLPIVDTALLDAVMRKALGVEEKGYLEFTEPITPSHTIPEYLLKHFRNIENLVKKGIYMAYVRFERGDVIYMVQSKRNISDVLPLILAHKAGGYIRPLQLAHHGVKISYKEARTNLDILVNSLRSKEPALKVFVKYGRAPLE